MTIATAPDRPVSRAEHERLEAEVTALKAMLIAHLPDIASASANLTPIKTYGIDTGFSDTTIRRRACLPEGDPKRIELRKIGGRTFVVRR